MNSWQTPRLFLRERNETGLSRLDSLATNQRKGETGINGEAVAAISEAIGVVAILISLAYLAVQIRQSTHEFSRGIEANQLAAFERNIESGNRLREVLLLNPDLIDLMTKGYASYTTLDAAAKIRFGLLLRNIFSSMQAFIFTLFTLLLFKAGVADERVEQDCGRIIRHLTADAVIFALCPSLPDLNTEELAATVTKVIANAGGVGHGTVIYFVNDESVVEPRSGWPQDLGRRIKSWGAAYVGWHSLLSGKMTIRDHSSGGWRTVDLPFPQVPSNNALRLKTGPYAGFQVSIDVRQQLAEICA